MKRTILRLLALSTLVVSIAASPATAQRGSADFTRYVALGDSFGAGYTNGSLVATHQQFSYPAVIARQAGAPDFQQPLISEPGIPPELRLMSLVPSPVIAPKASTNGAPINLNLPRPYNNLSVPGFRVGNVLRTTGATQADGPMAQIILRGQAPAVDQALALQPTFITVWIGGNDVLGGILGGTAAALTPIDSFRADYAALLDRLIAGAPNAGIVVGGIPDISRIPFANLVPPVLMNPATGQPVPGPDGQPIFLFAELEDGGVGTLAPGSRVTLPAAALIATGYGIPPQLAPLFPQLPNAGRPLPGNVVLTPSEWQTIHTRRAEVDASIKEIAGARNIPVADMDALFGSLAQGVNVAGIQFSDAFITGGIISLDGFHFTDIGYTFMANTFIRAINEAYGTRIPLASLSPFFVNNAAGTPIANPIEITFHPSAFDAIVPTFTAPVPAEPARSRRSRGVTRP